jgi:transposase-like protein
MTPRKVYSIEFKRTVLEEAAVSTLVGAARNHSLDPRMVRRWRQALDEKGEGPEMTLRKVYSIEFKRAVLAEAAASTLAGAARKHSLDPRMVRRWRQASLDEEGEGAPAVARFRIKGGGRKRVLGDLENVILDWIVDCRQRKLVVLRKDIQGFARTLASEMLGDTSKFKASKHWLHDYLTRMGLSLRRSKTLFKLDDDKVVARCVSFSKYMDAIQWETYDNRWVIAMDETAVYYGEDSQTTVDIAGATSVAVPSTGYESAQVTCILAIRRNGEKLPPLIIQKGGTGDNESIQSMGGVLVIKSPRAWSTQQVLRKWIEHSMPVLLRGPQRALLVWDSAPTHRAEDMKSFLTSHNVDQAMIPSGTTAYLQSLDIVINKPFKDNVRASVNDYIKHRAVRDVRGKMVKPPLDEVVSWVRTAWESIDGDTVEKALRASFLHPDMNLSETAIWKHERLGAMFQQKILEEAADDANEEGKEEESDLEDAICVFDED